MKTVVICALVGWTLVMALAILVGQNRPARCAESPLDTPVTVAGANQELK